MGSVFAAVARSRALPRIPAIQTARRHLGETVAGPQITNIPANLKIAQEFFTKPVRSYKEFKQQCEALRIFVFAGVTGGCVLSLIMSPPKSSYWRRMSPVYALSNIKACLMGDSPPLFLTEKVEHEANTSLIVSEL